MVCYSYTIPYFKNVRNSSVSEKAVLCKSSHLNCCPMAFLNRCHESSWHKERLLWEFLLGVLPKGRKAEAPWRFPLAVSGMLCPPSGSIGFFMHTRGMVKKLALQWGLMWDFEKSVRPFRSLSPFLHAWKKRLVQLKGALLCCINLCMKPVLNSSGDASSLLL